MSEDTVTIEETETIVEQEAPDPHTAQLETLNKQAREYLAANEWEAGKKVLEQAERIRRQGIEIEDVSGPTAVQRVLDLPFFRDPEIAPRG